MEKWAWKENQEDGDGEAWLTSGPISFGEGRRWSTQKEELCLAAHGSGQGAAVGILQDLLRALALVRYSQCQALPMLWADRKPHWQLHWSLCNLQQRGRYPLALCEHSQALQDVLKLQLTSVAGHQVLRDFFNSGFGLLSVLMCKY